MEIVKKNTLLRRLMMLVAIVAIGVSMAACSDDDDDEQGGGADLMAGYWYCKAPNREIFLDFSNKKVFAGECYYFALGKGCEFAGVYTLSGNNVKIEIQTCTDGREFPELNAGTVLTGTIDGEKLVMKIAGYNYRFERDLDDPNEK